jgi:hypothetical protein
MEPRAGHEPAPEEEVYRDAIKRVLDQFAQDEERDSDSDRASTGPAVIKATRKARERAVEELRKDAEEFIKGGGHPAHHSETAFGIRAVYAHQLYHIGNSLFTVAVVEENSVAIDLHISVSHRPEPASPEQSDLFDAMSKTKTVITTVCKNIEYNAENSLLKRLFGHSRASERERDRAKHLRHQYMRKLAGVGEKGLHGPHTELANRELQGLRQEFVAQEAGRIKNEYVVRLLIVSAIATTILLGLYAAIHSGRITAPFWTFHKPFLIAAAGSAIGAWLSFSIRRVDLSFDDLITLDRDWLDPILRILFIIGLTMTACLLFWKEVINIDIGLLKTAKFSGATALLIGIFSGIAERGLATAISGRATAFVNSVGSGGSP